MSHIMVNWNKAEWTTAVARSMAVKRFRKIPVKSYEVKESFMPHMCNRLTGLPINKVIEKIH